MTTPTLKLSDLAGPDADGWSDVAVFVRADGSESEPFVIVSDVVKGRNVTVNYGGLRGEVTFTGGKVRRLGRGRLVPARIEMQGDELSPTSMKLAEAVIDSEKVLKEAYREQVATLRTALQVEITDIVLRNRGSTHWLGCEVDHPKCAALARMRAALAATAPTPTEDAK